MRYLYQAQPDLEVVVCEDDGAIVDAIDERTLLVPISHVLFKTGEIQEIEPIIRRAHEVGAYVILDCYQSAGIVPFDVTALDVDFAVGGSVKWLCGGPATAGSTSGPTWRSGSGRRSRAGRRTSGRSASRRRWNTPRARRASSPGRRTSRRCTPRRRATT